MSNKEEEYDKKEKRIKVIQDEFDAMQKSIKYLEG